MGKLSAPMGYFCKVWRQGCSRTWRQKDKNWHKELPSVLRALQTNINRATRDTPFSLVYGAEVVLSPKIYLESTRVAHFNPEEQAEARELDANLLEERCNTALSNVRKYQMAQKRYYNKSVIQKDLNVGDLVLKKDICTKDKHKFSTLWEGPFIVVDVVTLGAYVLAEVDRGMLPNTWNVDQLRKYYVWYLYMIKGIQVFLPMKLTLYPVKTYTFYTCSTTYKK
jgi:hypothetical protein